MGWKEGPGWVSRSLLQGEPTGPSKQTEPARVLFCRLAEVLCQLQLPRHSRMSGTSKGIRNSLVGLLGFSDAEAICY